MSNDKNWHSSIDLMKNRMWSYTARENYSKNLNENADAGGIPQQERILRPNGGYGQQDRMIFDKSRSLDRALVYSYQGANIQKVDSSSTEEFPVTRGLINPNKLKQDYDDKILSVHTQDGFKPGDIFRWMNTNTYWIIYLQDLTELAYFRGDIRKCSYQIDWVDDEGNKKSTYAAVRGPTETKIDYIQKHTISVDNPNYSLNILMPKNKDTLAYFQRYSKFYLRDEEVQPSNVCWRVEAIDWVSMPGVLEVNATEYYSNATEDDIENGLVGTLLDDSSEKEEVSSLITGDGFIKPKKEYTYTYTGSNDGTWSFVKSNAPVKITVDSDDSKKVVVKWMSTYSGQFDLYYGDESKTIVVESLF